MKKASSDSKKSPKSRKSKKKNKKGRSQSVSPRLTHESQESQESEEQEYVPKPLRHSPLRQSGYSCQASPSPEQDSDDAACDTSLPSPPGPSSIHTTSTSDDDPDPPVKLLVQWGEHLIPYKVWMCNYHGEKPNFSMQCAWCVGQNEPQSLDSFLTCQCLKYIYCRESCRDLFIGSGHKCKPSP